MKSDGSILSDLDLQNLFLAGCPAGVAHAGPDDDIEEEEEVEEEKNGDPEEGEATAPEATTPIRTRGM